MTDKHRRPASVIPSLAGIAWAAIRVRYRLSQPLAALRAAAAVLDVLVYAAVVYFILGIVFQRSGFERFELILIGFVAFSWSIRCMLEARNFGELRDRMTEHASRPVAAAATACLAPPGFTFLLSLAVAVAIELAVLGSATHLSQIAWLAAAIAIHLVWNAALVLALGIALDRRWISGVMPVVLCAGIVWLMSPIMYRFEDIPSPANPLLTTLNPASHILAAYHNALWRAEPMSLVVLPAAGAIGLLAVAWLVPRARRAAPTAAWAAAGARSGSGPHLIALLDGAGAASAREAGTAATPVFTRWRGEIGGLSGEDLLTVLASAGPSAAEPEAVARIGAESRIGRLFGDSLAIYPPWALAQLAFATALASPAASLVLDGILDEVRPGFLAEAWARLEAEAGSGRPVIVVSTTTLSLPWTAKGSFEAIGAGGQRRAGTIGPELDAAYHALRGDRPGRG